MKTTETAKKTLDKILDSFEAGNVPEALAIALLPKQNVPSSSWSFGNRWIQAIEGTQDSRSFLDWKKVGRYPKKGSKAIYILAPIVVTKREKNEAGREEKKTFIAGFKAQAKFRYEDTDGEPIEQTDLTPPQPPPLAEVAEEWKIKVLYEGRGGDYRGYFVPAQNVIGLVTHDEKVWFHELAHAAHQRVSGRLKGGQDWKQEIVAELAAATLLHLYRRRTNDGQAYRYIRRYAEKAGLDAHRASLAVLKEVGLVLEEIIGAENRIEKKAA